MSVATAERARICLLVVAFWTPVPRIGSASSASKQRHQKNSCCGYFCWVQNHEWPCWSEEVLDIFPVLVGTHGDNCTDSSRSCPQPLPMQACSPPPAPECWLGSRRPHRPSTQDLFKAIPRVGPSQRGTEGSFWLRSQVVSLTRNFPPSHLTLSFPQLSLFTRSIRCKSDLFSQPRPLQGEDSPALFEDAVQPCTE